MIYAGYTLKKSSDEQYTPAYAVAPIIKYIPGNKIVWCPFDTEHSEYVLALKAAGIRRLWHAALHSANRLRYCFPTYG